MSVESDDIVCLTPDTDDLGLLLCSVTSPQDCGVHWSFSDLQLLLSRPWVLSSCFRGSPSSPAFQSSWVCLGVGLASLSCSGFAQILESIGSCLLPDSGSSQPFSLQHCFLPLPPPFRGSRGTVLGLLAPSHLPEACPLSAALSSLCSDV